MKIRGNRGKLFIAFQTVEVNDHERINGVHIFLSSYVFVLEIMVNGDNKTQSCTFQFVKRWKEETWAHLKKIFDRFITFSRDK